MTALEAARTYTRTPNHRGAKQLFAGLLALDLAGLLMLTPAR
jgi:hypothetical protein